MTDPTNPQKTLAPPGQDETYRMVAVAAHQLKSPLTTIQSLISLLLGGFAGPISAPQRELLEKAHARAARGTSLISDIVRMRSLEGIHERPFEPVDLVDSLGTSLMRARDTAEVRQVDVIDLSDPGAGEWAWAHGEATVIREILQVLVDNAVKYTPAGGRVSCRLLLLDQEPQAPTLVGVEVVDTGIGIPPEAWSQLFQEFYRAPNARDMNEEGTGLGLSFAARAARALGGDLLLEPADTGGVRALLSLAQVPHPAPRVAGSSSGDSTVEPPFSRRIVIVGGVAAGSKCAARILRLDAQAQVTIIERGRFLAYAGCGLPYYISGTVRDQGSLLASPCGDTRESAFFHRLKTVRTLDRTEVTEIDRDRKRVTARNLLDDSILEIPYDRLVLATGARAHIPEIGNSHLKGIYTLHGMEDAEAIRVELRESSAREVVIVGGGVLGCEITESVAIRGSRIHLIESRPNVLGVLDPELGLLLEKHMESRGIRVITRARVASFEGTDRVQAVLMADGRRLPCELAILATGIRPNVELAVQGGLELGSTGAISVDDQMRTSDPEVFAIGDCVESHSLVTGKPIWFPMGSTAAKMGRVAAAGLCDRVERFPGVVGSMVMKVFDFTVSATGMNESDARAAGFDPISVLIPTCDRAHYLPTSQTILLKMVADRQSRRILGAQGIGRGSVVKRIEVVAAAITAGLDLDRFANTDLPYAPPYSLALDGILAAANALRNKIDGLWQGISSLQLHERLARGDDLLLVDLRLPAEYGTHRLPHNLHIPIGSLRGRLHEIPAGREIVLISKSGLRGYEASLVLQRAGFEQVLVLDGGLDAWPFELERI